MDKQHEAGAPDSISTVGVTVKDYPPSEVFTEPPPAYVRPRANAVQIARIAAVTLIAVSFILGGFMLASAYITATMSCNFDQPEYSPQQQEPEDRPTFQHLVDPLDTEETTQGKNVASPPAQDVQDKPIQIKLPLQLDFDEIAGSLMEKNQKARMNCVVEKRRAEEVMDHQPKTVRLPFGLNLTTDPRYEHITGERMAIFCESGNEQRHVPMEQQMTPIMIPVPVPHPVPVQRMMHHPPPPPQGHPFFPRPQPFAQQQVPPQVLFHQAQPVHPMHQMHQIPPQMLHQIPPHAQRPHPQQHAAGSIHIQQMHQPQNDEQIQIIREEHVIPVLQVETEELIPEARGFQHPIPNENKAPLLPPFHRLPVHIPQQPQQEQIPQEQHRPHFVQPRSVRSIDSVLHRRDKRVRRCACDCSC